MSTFTVESFISSMFSTVPTFIPENLMVLPTCNPLTFLNFVEILKTGSNMFFCFPMMKIANKNNDKPAIMNIPNLILNPCLVVSIVIVVF